MPERVIKTVDLTAEQLEPLRQLSTLRPMIKKVLAEVVFQVTKQLEQEEHRAWDALAALVGYPDLTSLWMDRKIMRLEAETKCLLLIDLKGDEDENAESKSSGTNVVEPGLGGPDADPGLSSGGVQEHGAVQPRAATVDQDSR